MVESKPDKEKKGDRIAKLMARAGLCSRRDAERWIADGRVQLDGKTLSTPATVVDDPARITVDGAPLPQPEAPQLWRYHKPAGLVTSSKDEKGRATVFDKLPAHLPRVIAVGRLDLNTEGLLLLTNDGGLARALELPKTGWVRRYRVRVYGRVSAEALSSLKNGITIDGVRYGAIEARMEKRTLANAWIEMSFAEGKNREVRRVLEHLGLKVNRLIRTAYGPFSLDGLVRGAVKPVSNRHMRDKVGALLGEASFGGEAARTKAAGRPGKKGWAKAKKKPARRKPSSLDKKSPKPKSKAKRKRR